MNNEETVFSMQWPERKGDPKPFVPKMADKIITEEVNEKEPLFILMASDITAPSAIAQWILRNLETAEDDTLRAALEIMLKMRKWPARTFVDLTKTEE